MIQLRGIPFVFRNVNDSEHPKPLNSHLLDEDCVYVLKRCYEGFTKKELAMDEDAMTSFFGSVELGRSVLGTVTDEHWDSLE